MKVLPFIYFEVVLAVAAMMFLGLRDSKSLFPAHLIYHACLIFSVESSSSSSYIRDPSLFQILNSLFDMPFLWGAMWGSSHCRILVSVCSAPFIWKLWIFSILYSLHCSAGRSCFLARKHFTRERDFNCHIIFFLKPQFMQWCEKVINFSSAFPNSLLGGRSFCERK